MSWSVQFGGLRTDRFSAGAALLSLTLLTLPLLAGCMGDLGPFGSSSGHPGGRSPGGPGSPGGDGDGDGDGGVEALQGPSAGLRRLTVSEYRHSVSDLLGVSELSGDALQADTRMDGFTSIGATRVSFSANQVEQFEQAAYTAAAQIFDDESRRAEFVGCEPVSAADPCVRDFLSTFGRRVFRRPASGAEIDVYAGLVSAAAADSDVWQGLAYAVAAYLQSPSFLYRVELGEPDDTLEGHNRLTAFEVATRLSYLVTGSTPDDQLLDAAESGELDGDEGLRAHMERLLALPRSEDVLFEFFKEQLELDHVSKIVKLLDLYPTFSPDLAEAMQHEMYEVVRDIALRNPDDLLTLLSRRDTYVNGPLAALYGLPAPPVANEWVAVTLPEDGPRAGLLGFAGFLASHAGPAETSVTKRGFFVVSKLLCRTIPSPPDDVETLLPAPPVGGHATMRERVEQHMEDPSCANCHSQMDPPGLALEHFDALGNYRETDKGLGIDATGEIDGEPFDGARELGDVLASHPDVAACFASRFYQFALGTQSHSGAPVSDLLAAFDQSGRKFPELVRAVVMHDVFRLVSAAR